MSDYLKNYLKAIENPLPELKKSFEAEFEFVKKMVHPKMTLVDVGCGAARPAVDVAPFVQKLVGFDINPLVLDMARERCEEIANAHFIRDDALNMGFTSKTFDVSFCTYNLIGSLEKSERQRMVNEMQRVTKPFGIVVNITWKQNRATTDFLKKYYSSIGIDIFEIDKKKSITSKGTFDRLSKKELAGYYTKAGLDRIGFVDIGPVWVAIVGTKPKGEFDDLV